MKLEIIKGKESSLIIEDAVDSVVNNGFLSDSYSKAFEALSDYIKNSDEARGELEKEVSRFRQNEILYCTPKNIIAFSGERGSGKTSAMLSFASTLNDRKKLEDLNHEKDFDVKKMFIVLDPIDPTALEDNQSILSVFLSKLLFIAEERWNQSADFYRHFQDAENKKMKLLTYARQCLNGISAIKGKKGIPESLSDLQRVGDSSILKKNLYDFVELFIDFYSKTDQIGHKTKDFILVFQIDDTDCQVCRGYEVLEDIRKYLTIPNVLILMATDTELLRQVLIRHYISDFSNNLKEKMIEIGELRSLGEKYMTKLLPPTQVIYLPNIDKVIRDKMDVVWLSYKSEGKDLLSDVCGEREYELQEMFLRYIYRKTHIVFTAHSAYANNIIPTTLRGFSHFLKLLSTMEDIPEIEFPENISEDTVKECLIDGVECQLPILEKNLNLFEEYFLNDWVHTKLPQNFIEIIGQLSGRVPAQRFEFIIDKLKKYYFSNDALQNLPTYLENTPPSYLVLDEMIRWIQGTLEGKPSLEAHRTETDLYFIFAVRTFFTIENNKDVLKVKRQKVKDFKTGNGEKIVFDYLKGKTSLPTGFYMESVDDLHGYPLINDIEIQNLQEAPYYFQHKGMVVCFNFSGGIIQWLSPEKSDCEPLTQEQIYKAQELAILMAANCDVQEVVRKTVSREAKKNNAKLESLEKAVEKGLWLIQNAIAGINGKMLKSYEVKDEEESYWRIADSAKSMFTIYEDKLKTELDKKQNSSEYQQNNSNPVPQMPKVQYNPPTGNENVNAFNDKQEDYHKRIEDYLNSNDVPKADEIREVLNRLMSFNPEFEDEDGKIINEKEFNETREEMNSLIEKSEDKYPQK